jgi:hypothetical protein
MNISLATDRHYMGPPFSDELQLAAEQALGLRLPSAYVDLLRHTNGGVPVLRRFNTTFPTSWATNCFEITAILGVGGPRGIDSGEGLGSNELIREWGYPNVGVVICDTPSAGHDTVMLDYRESGPNGEPAVVYIDEDREPRQISTSFDGFVSALTYISD